MDTSLDRWRRAQGAEAEHSSHESMPDSLEWPRTHFEERFGVPLTELHDTRILEVGCGTGMIHAFDFPCVNVGVDPMSMSIQDVVQESSARIVNGAGEKLPFGDGIFDYVICYNVLDHVQSPPSVLEEIRRVTSMDGEVFLSVNTFSAIKPLLRVADRVDPPHPHHFTVSEVNSIVTESGFEVIDAKSTSASASNLKGYIADFVFGLELYHLRMRHSGVAPS